MCDACFAILCYSHAQSERDRCVRYLSACLSCLGSLLGDLGRLFSPTPQGVHPTRSPLSLHLPLMRHVSCFLSLAVMQHGADLSDLLSSFLYPRPYLLRRFMSELANTLLGCQEVIVGYWIRNGQALRQSITHYMQSQLCYSFIDLDIFALQAAGRCIKAAILWRPVNRTIRSFDDVKRPRGPKHLEPIRAGDHYYDHEGKLGPHILPNEVVEETNHFAATCQRRDSLAIF
ncbi:unnamed protein product [Echinostoma caproni]|uniref:E3 ubiquitin-protein ligase n=1 Tax=Echinostoma caproni TaxID=27848 RepID=A0A183AEL8_9TREM|nr:unnamed protein product [Echinostoma caproni]